LFYSQVRNSWGPEWGEGMDCINSNIT
jgi:hypothetical protein